MIGPGGGAEKNDGEKAMTGIFSFCPVYPEGRTS
jgi:hypothetical protein